MSESPLLDYVVRNLERRKGQWPAIARASGISLRTLQKVGMRETTDPHVRMVEKLGTFFRGLRNRKQIPNGHDRARA